MNLTRGLSLKYIKGASSRHLKRYPLRKTVSYLFEREAIHYHHTQVIHPLHRYEPQNVAEALGYVVGHGFGVLAEAAVRVGSHLSHFYKHEKNLPM